jgi:uncharacterized protein
VIRAPTAARFRLRRWLAGIACAFAFALLATAGAMAEVAVPTLKAHVTDLTGTLTAQQVAALEQPLAALEKRKGSQVVILMLPTTQPESIEAYSLKVAEANRLGRDEVDDGLLLIVAKDDRKARIEVGYGLEGVVTDAISSRVIREYLAPHFRENDYAGGLAAASEVLVKLVDGEPLPPPMAAAPREDGGNPSWFFAIFIGLFIGVFAAGTRIKPLFLRRFGAGGVAAAIAFLVVGGAAALAVAAIVAFLLSGASAVSGGRYIGHGGGGGWGGGGFGGGSGGGFGGGGFSGGGGGFGGGGASGGW